MHLESINFSPTKVIDTHFALLRLLQVHLDYPTEYLTSVSGYTREDSCHVINSLTFHSNKRAHGPIGEEKGKFFSFPQVSGKIIGFYGRCGYFLDSIGAHFGPVVYPYPFEVVGPFGNGKNRWDDGKHADIRQIVVVAGSAIESVSFPMRRVLLSDTVQLMVAKEIWSTTLVGTRCLINITPYFQ